MTNKTKAEREADFEHYVRCIGDAAGVNTSKFHTPKSVVRAVEELKAERDKFHRRVLRLELSRETQAKRIAEQAEEIAELRSLCSMMAGWLIKNEPDYADKNDVEKDCKSLGVEL